MGGNSFYNNSEAYAFEILQQKLFKEAQRSAQQTLMELSALKSFLAQGQLLYCIPFGGAPLQPPPPVTYPFCPINGLPLSESPCHISDPHHPALPLSSTSPSNSPGNAASVGTSTGTSNPLQLSAHHANQSVVHVNVKNAQSKIVTHKAGK